MLPGVAVLVLTMFDDDATVFTAMQAGARGYLLKGADQDEIARAIRAVVAGEVIFGPQVAARVLNFFTTSTATHPAEESDPAFPELSNGSARSWTCWPQVSGPRRSPRAVPVSEDGQQQPDRDLRQAAGRQPRRGHRARPRAGPGWWAVTSWGLAAVALVAGTCVAAGLLMVQQRMSRACGGLLAATGVVGLFATWLLVGEESRSAAAPVLLVACLVLFPAALWAYPRPLWRHPVDFVLGVLLVSPGVAAVVTAPAPGVVESMILLALVVLVAQTWWRLEHADGPDRRALLWSSLALGCAVMFALTVTFLVADPDVWLRVAVAPMATVPVAMAIGVLRPEIVEVRALVVNAVVVLVLAMGYIAGFVGVVSLVELLGAAELSRAALAVVGLLGAIAFHPAEKMLRGVIDQLLFGDRPDPLDAATRVVGRIE